MYIYIYIYIYTHSCIDISIKGWIDGGKGRWTHGCMDEHMDEQMYRWIVYFGDGVTLPPLPPYNNGICAKDVWHDDSSLIYDDCAMDAISGFRIFNSK